MALTSVASDAGEPLPTRARPRKAPWIVGSVTSASGPGLTPINQSINQSRRHPPQSRDPHIVALNLGAAVAGGERSNRPCSEAPTHGGWGRGAV